jgi:hypothetical protein
MPNVTGEKVYRQGPEMHVKGMFSSPDPVAAVRFTSVPRMRPPAQCGEELRLNALSGIGWDTNDGGCLGDGSFFE